MYPDVLLWRVDVDEVITHAIVNLTGTLMTVVEVRNEFQFRTDATLKFNQGLTHVGYLHLVQDDFKEAYHRIDFFRLKRQCDTIDGGNEYFHNHSLPLMISL
jgi:hypothetical protein